MSQYYALTFLWYIFPFIIVVIHPLLLYCNKTVLFYIDSSLLHFSVCIAALDLEILFTWVKLIFKKQELSKGFVSEMHPCCAANKIHLYRKFWLTQSCIRRPENVVLKCEVTPAIGPQLLFEIEMLLSRKFPILPL